MHHRCVRTASWQLPSRPCLDVLLPVATSSMSAAMFILQGRTMPGAKVKLGKEWDEGVLVITYSLLVSGTRKSVVRPGNWSVVQSAYLPLP